MLIDEIIQRLKQDKKTKRLVVFLDREGKKTPTKLTVTITRLSRGRYYFKLSEGPLNNAERNYAVRYYALYDKWPLEWCRPYPKRRSAK